MIRMRNRKNQNRSLYEYMGANPVIYLVLAVATFFLISGLVSESVGKWGVWTGIVTGGVAMAGSVIDWWKNG